MTNNKMTFKEIPQWHQEMIHQLMSMEFPGKDEIEKQLSTAYYEIIDSNGSLSIFPVYSKASKNIRTIPVEALATDIDDTPISILLFQSKGFVYSLEILRADGEPVKQLPKVEKSDCWVSKN